MLVVMILDFHGKRNDCGLPDNLLRLQNEEVPLSNTPPLPFPPTPHPGPIVPMGYFQKFGHGVSDYITLLDGV